MMSARKTVKTIGRKLNNKGAFTLAETLVAVLILLMVSSIVAAGIPVAKNACEKVVLTANAELLLSTTISTLRNELGTAQGVVRVDDTTLTYFNENIGATSKITIGPYEYADLGKTVNTILYQRYAAVGGMSAQSDVVRLISRQASTDDLYPTYDSVTYEDGVITFSNLKVNQPGRQGLAGRPTVSIRVIGYSR